MVDVLLVFGDGCRCRGEKDEIKVRGMGWLYEDKSLRNSCVYRADFIPPACIVRRCNFVRSFHDPLATGITPRLDKTASWHRIPRDLLYSPRSITDVFKAVDEFHLLPVARELHKLSHPAHKSSICEVVSWKLPRVRA